MPSLTAFSRRVAVVFAAIPFLAPGAEAKKRRKKRRKKRCLALLARCAPGAAPRCCDGTICGTSQIAGSSCCRQQDSACAFSPTQDECCPGFACSEASGVCVPLE